MELGGRGDGKTCVHVKPLRDSGDSVHQITKVFLSSVAVGGVRVRTEKHQWEMEGLVYIRHEAGSGSGDGEVKWAGT